MLVSSALCLGLWLAAAHSDAPLVTVPDPQAVLKPETEPERKARHATLAKVRAGTAVVLHREAWEYAPENTLSGIRAAAEIGAGGVELDFHRTLDGVIVLLHNDRLERLLDGIGRVDQCYYEELLLYTYNAHCRRRRPTPSAVPTLRDLLQTLRSNALLVVLDLKCPGMDAEMLEEFRRADMLDHVAGYSPYNSRAWQQAKIPLPSWKSSLMGHDTDPREASAVLKQPGSLVMMDDGRATLSAPGQTGGQSLAAAVGPPGRSPASLLGHARICPARHVEAIAGATGSRPSGDLCTPAFCRVGRRIVHRSKRRVAPCHGLEPGHDRQTSPGVGFRCSSSRAAPSAERSRHECSGGGRRRLRPGEGSRRRPDPRQAARRPACWQRPVDGGREAARRAAVAHRSPRPRYAFGLALLGVNSPAVTDVLVNAVRHRTARHRT